MINIYRKTPAELAQENAEYIYAARLVGGIPFTACSTYLRKSDGTRIDTSRLTEEQIIALIEEDVKDFSSPDGSYKKFGRSDLDTFYLLKALRGSWTPSYEALLHIFSLEDQYGHIIADILGTLDENDIVGKARIIAEFQKQSSGDFEPVTSLEVRAVIQQMAINKQMKKRSMMK